MGQKEDSSASAGRRKALRDADPLSYGVDAGRPIAFYLDLMKRLLASFESAMDDRRLDDAYIFGIRFASFCLEGLPKHPGYKATMRALHAKQVEGVLAGVEDVTARMDAEELAMRQQQAKEREEQAREREEQAAKQQEARQESVEKSAMAKLMALQRNTSQRDNTIGASTSTEAKQASSKPRTVKKSLPSALDSLPSLQKVSESSMAREATNSSNFSDGLCPDEQRTIRLLEHTIQRQMARLPHLETAMDCLRAHAKEALRNDQRRTAVGKMAQRKRLQKTLAACKSSIFSMETQIMRIEAAASDRDANLAMKKASSMMKELQNVVADDHVDTVHDELSELQNVNDALSQNVLDDLDEDALLSELMEEDAGPAAEDLPENDLLQLPSLKNTTPTKQDEAPTKEPLMATIA